MKKNALIGQSFTEDVRIVPVGGDESPYGELAELSRCHQCGQCAAVCPSQRHGGIRPADTMVRLNLSLLFEDAPELWLCTMCNSCTERCQLGASPSDRIQEMRGRASMSGHCPKAFMEEAKLFIRSGLAFPNSGLTKKVRKELGLPDLVMDPRTMEELVVLIEASSMGRVPLE
jgi:heterodisulfide reductase subunit C